MKSAQKVQMRNILAALNYYITRLSKLPLWVHWEQVFLASSSWIA